VGRDVAEFAALPLRDKIRGQPEDEDDGEN
jgi:hypothetical protein